MSHVVIIGCGIIGASIAYELSLIKGLRITVLDKQAPAQASTGAALGVLMGVISHKVKGKAWKLRQTSIQRYETLIPELESITGLKIPFNRQGILLLLPKLDENSTPEVEEQVAKENWEKLVEIRQSQGWQLEILDIPKLKNICPQVDENELIGAVYSPQDRQLDPTALTLALVEGAQRNGVTFKFGVNVLSMSLIPKTTDVVSNLCQKIITTADCFVIASGLGSTVLTTQLKQKLDIRPVLGQALQLHLGYPLGNSDFQPAITGNDVHIVPCGVGVGAITDYWVGATVEFPSSENEIPPDKALLDGIFKKAIAFCPELGKATVKRSWTGLRPRPEGRPAPVIEKLAGYENVLLATGHYRNGVLLAPATAYAIREMIIG